MGKYLQVHEHQGTYIEQSMHIQEDVFYHVEYWNASWKTSGNKECSRQTVKAHSLKSRKKITIDEEEEEVLFILLAVLVVLAFILLVALVGLVALASNFCTSTSCGRRRRSTENSALTDC